MSLLKRKGMKPLAKRFKYAWAEYRKGTSGRSMKPIPENVSSEQFKGALSVFGITTAEELGGIIGVNTRQAYNILSDPPSMTAERHKKLALWIDSCIHTDEQLINQDYEILERIKNEMGLVDYRLSIDEDYYSVANEEFEKLAEQYNKLKKDIEDDERALDLRYQAAKTLTADKYEKWIEREAKTEFQGRALIEGFSQLGESDRSVLLKMLDGMLSGYERDDATGIRKLLYETGFGERAGMMDLAALVSGKSRRGEVLDPEATLDEYAGEALTGLCGHYEILI